MHGATIKIKSEDVAKRLKLQANIDTNHLTRRAINIKQSSTEFGLKILASQLELRSAGFNTRCAITQSSTVLIYFTAEA